MKAVIVGSDTGAIDFATLALRLRWPDVSPAVASNPAAGVALIEEVLPEVVLLHPDDTCTRLGEVIQQVRRSTTAPLLVLGRHGNELETVTALTMGADDYVKLPCDVTEVMVRVWARIRRVSLGAAEPPPKALLRRGPLLMDIASQETYLEDQPLCLTPTEFRLLRKLVENEGAVVTHHALSSAICSRDSDDGSTVKKYIQRLRSKLGDDAQSPRWISCVRSVGYRFVGPSSDDYPGAPARRQLLREFTPEVAFVA